MNDTIRGYIVEFGQRQTDRMIADHFDVTQARVAHIRRRLGMKRNMQALWSAHNAGVIQAGRGPDIVPRRRKNTELSTLREREDQMARAFARKLARAEGITT